MFLISAARPDEVIALEECLRGKKGWPGSIVCSGSGSDVFVAARALMLARGHEVKVRRRIETVDRGLHARFSREYREVLAVAMARINDGR